MRALPRYARFLDQLQAIGRLIVLHRRGLGTPEPHGPQQVTLEDWVSDARSALETAGANSPIVVGVAEGAITAIALAARHPERVTGLVLLNPTPGPSLTPLSRAGVGPRYIDLLRWRPETWALETPGLEVVAPSLGRDESFAAWISDAFVAVRGPNGLSPALHLVFRSDARALLSSVRAPTLVVHRRDDAWFTPDHGRLIARAIPGARYLELAGADHAPYVGNTAEILDAITWFAHTLPTLEPGEADDQKPGLTPRQAQILQLVAEGLTDKQISAQLRLSPRTIHKHLERAYRRLGVQNRTAAARAMARRRRPTRSTTPPL
ncbi:MAG TPA: alpha/beta fold hydrolase [Solirubrobacteraceae bacterium]|nr:alpha/beta fold hydrolase [Solirubrobacteraceae bacterium]